MGIRAPVAAAEEISASATESSVSHLFPASGAPITESYWRLRFRLRLRCGGRHDGCLRIRSSRSRVRRFLTRIQEQGWR
ncbi:hypothetical protein B296_00055272 [Ensete ventricosum]|uniref:Uncharacterized protein n=1 Tax=Ensete ventricosum TaxID=4639 RepID=A0A426WXG6_ENSVE|nr:hypothetical protein B296_00055272 [Ensete ventricosum]